MEQSRVAWEVVLQDVLSKEILLYTGEEILKEDMQVCLLVLGNKLH